MTPDELTEKIQEDIMNSLTSCNSIPHTDLGMKIIRDACIKAMSSSVGEALKQVRVTFTEDKPTRQMIMDIEGPREIMEKLGFYYQPLPPIEINVIVEI